MDVLERTDCSGSEDFSQLSVLRESMNRSTDLAILRANPEAAGTMAKAIRKGIVKGFLAVKNFDKKLTENEIRRIYKIPEFMTATFLANGTLLFSCPSNAPILVTQDGDVQRGES